MMTIRALLFIAAIEDPIEHEMRRVAARYALRRWSPRV